MPIRFPRTLATSLALAALAAPLLAASAKPKPQVPARPAAMAPTDIIKSRQSGLKEMGAAFKAIMDGMRGEPQTILIQQSAKTIKAHSQDIYRWFPVGSGPRPGVKTAAKPEIWTKPAEFKTAQDNLAKAAEALNTAAASGNMAAVGPTLRPLGAACKGCHDQFRVPDEHDRH